MKNLATGEIIHDQSDILISARGNLNNPAWPEIDGLDAFKGELMHSAKWNERYVLRREVMRKADSATATTGKISV